MILLVDDDDDFRIGLAGALRDDGHDVVECHGPAELPAAHVLDRVELVISDYLMPGTTGLTFADQYHAARPTVPIVLVTAHWSQHLEAQVELRGFVRLYRKPLDYREIEAILPQPRS